MSTEFSEKNRLRKLHFDGRNRAHKSARLRRREMNGAFGRESGGTWNELIAGTSGSPRGGSSRDDLSEMITAGGSK